MKTFIEYLNEGRDASLFHATSPGNASAIIEGNMFRGTSSHPSEAPGVSLTRDFTTAVKFGKARWNTGIVIFELDQRRLAQNVKIAPYNFHQIMRPNLTPARYSTDYANDTFNEFEERVSGNIKNADRYILSLICSDPSVVQHLPISLKRYPKLYIYSTGQWVNK